MVAAHELAHHLEAQRYGNAVQRRADTILHEGMATWIAGEYWLLATDFHVHGFLRPEAGDTLHQSAGIEEHRDSGKQLDDLWPHVVHDLHLVP